jgi:uncharacterized membrane protein
MSFDATTILAILAMAVVTYITRVAGLFVADRLVLTGRAKAAFDAIPPLRCWWPSSHRPH